MSKTYYDEKIETLDENLRCAIDISDWKESLTEIQKQFKLHIDQTQVLEDSTLQLMFGDIDAPDFINNMFNNAHINSETAADILLEVDLKILKKIREDLVDIEEGEKEEEEIKNFLLDDEEKKSRAENEIYSKYYAEVDKIREEDENMDPEDIEDEEIPTDIIKERDDILSEIDTPTKSFTIGLKPTQSTYQSSTLQTAPQPISVDHQLENKHIEEPFHTEDLLPNIPKTETPQKIPTTINQTPQIKKPITINLDDIYREPIE